MFSFNTAVTQLLQMVSVLDRDKSSCSARGYSKHIYASSVPCLKRPSLVSHLSVGESEWSLTVVSVNNFRLIQNLWSLTSTLLTRPSWKEQSATLLVQMCRYLHQLQGNGLLTHDEHLQRKWEQERLGEDKMKILYIDLMAGPDCLPFILLSLCALDCGRCREGDMLHIRTETH